MAKKITGIYDQDASSQLNLGLVFIKLNEDSLAEDQFLRAHKLSKGFYPAVKNLGFYYYKTENYDKAKDYSGLSVLWPLLSSEF